MQTSHRFRFLVFLAATTISSAAFGQGLVVPGVGPVNRSMAGATVAAPIDAAGSLHWNPAAISGLPCSEVVIAAEFVLPETAVTSSVMGFSDRNRSDSGVSLLPTTAFVYKPKNSDWTFGLGMFGIGGFFVNYPANPANPVLSPPAVGGAGSIYSNFSVLQVAPTASVQLTDRLSVGFAPTVTTASLLVDPATFASPTASGYPAATHTRMHWGLGFQLGVYYTTENCWAFGASYKSPQWFEEFDFYTTDDAGLPRKLTLDADYPAITSLGISYSGFERTLLALDVRYVDFANSDFIGDPAAFSPTDFSVLGVGWDSVCSVSMGVQRGITDRLTMRMGYFFTENPISDEASFFNIASPAIYQHALFLGATHRLAQMLTLSWTYYHTFYNSVEGPIYAPGVGAVPNTSVHNSQVINGLSVGLGIHF